MRRNSFQLRDIDNWVLELLEHTTLRKHARGSRWYTHGETADALTREHDIKPPLQADEITRSVERLRKNGRMKE